MATALLEVGMLFVAAAIVNWVAERIGLSSVPLYILVGILLNEFVAGRLGGPVVTDGEFVTVGAELGIVLLLFYLGVEFDIDRLLSGSDQLVRAGLVDFVLNFGLGLVVGWLLFGSLVPAVVTAGVIYPSSSAIITRSLLELGWIANEESGPILGVLVFEDLVLAVYLAVVPAVLLSGGSPADAVVPAGIALGFVLLLAVGVRVGTGALTRLLDTTTAESITLRAFGTIVLLGGAALALGASEAVAAFFVGMAIGSTPFAEEVETRLSTLRDTFAVVFFVWIGLQTDPLSLPPVAVPIAVAAAISLPAKLVSGYLAGRPYALSDRRSLRVGLAMVTRGEFSLIVAATALAGAGGAITPALADRLYAFTVGYVLLLSLAGTVLMGEAKFFERRLFDRDSSGS